MIATHGIVHFTIPVADTRRAKEFYTSVLDLQVVDENPMMVFMKTGDSFFVLGKMPLHDHNPPSQVHHAFRVTAEEFDRGLKFLSEKGIEPFNIEDRQDGVFIGRSAYFRDPDNNVLEIIDLRKIGR